MFATFHSIRLHCLHNVLARWTIRGRVTQKSAIRTWSNSRGEGKLFNIVLVDESGEIRATAFTQEVEKFYNLIEVNKVIMHLSDVIDYCMCTECLYSLMPKPHTISSIDGLSTEVRCS
jgi:hypothetical protein